MIIHIDMSNHYEQGSHSVIAGVSVKKENSADQSYKRAVVVSEPARSTLLSEFDHTYIHAALIDCILPDTPIKKLIVCPDVNPTEKIMSSLQDLRPGMFGRVKSLNELREELGDPKLKSAADSFARNVKRNFHKRKNIHRRKKYFSDGTVIIIENKNNSSYKEIRTKLTSLKEKAGGVKRSNR